MRESKTALDHDVYLKTSYFPALDGLRAISVFLVFAVHFGGEMSGTRTGWLGVYVFFVLSGFLITTLLLREWDATGFVSLKAFYIRRSTRLMPVYFLVYLLVMVLGYFSQGLAWTEMKAATPYMLTFLNEFAGPSPWAITWSLGVEWKYYLVWPLLFALFGRTSTSRMGLALLCLGVTGALLIGNFYPAWFTPWFYFGLILGSLIAVAMHSRVVFDRLRGLMTNKAAFIIAFVLFVWYRRGALFEAHLGHATLIVVFSLLIGLLMPSLIVNSTYLSRALAWRPLVFIGQRSYAMYLIQVMAVQAVLFVFPGMLFGPFLLFSGFAVALLVADVLYRWFERPIARWGHGWAKAVKDSGDGAQRAPGVKPS